ncbi:hypothetical protein JX265_003851 [Neoarthrinium moseri]|uniref:Uncharacterized protein n=1 Tax=Neoarthrinium moseri TaxID=1658444 RepID=A0A9Q0ARD2_9PEZI|nr:uncharacterized protein JN550_009414 [Neoarthrinium moseri]KAI1863714.1 hypothetical protein JN550_009414 [Neoarthrinium moseri]KAI1876325.1 hypothetical protein JX265_003851 [Neoarthrinium moseri]
MTRRHSFPQFIAELLDGVSITYLGHGSLYTFRNEDTGCQAELTRQRLRNTERGMHFFQQILQWEHDEDCGCIWPGNAGEVTQDSPPALWDHAQDLVNNGVIHGDMIMLLIGKLFLGISLPSPIRYQGEPCRDTEVHPDLLEFTSDSDNASIFDPFGDRWALVDRESDCVDPLSDLSSTDEEGVMCPFDPPDGSDAELPLIEFGDVDDLILAMEPIDLSDSMSDCRFDPNETF